MKRLLKNAFIGNINKDDIELTSTNNKIYCYIKNKEKILNGVGMAGLINYKFFEGKKELYIELIRVNKVYKDTKIAMYMFKFFEENIINSLLDSYGDQLVIGADFLNHDLAELVERYCKKRGIQFKNYNEHPSKNLYNDEHIEYLRSKGIEAEKKGGTIIIRNADFDLVCEAMKEIDYKTEYNGNEFNGVICDNGDIEYTVFEALMPDNGIQFRYYENQPRVLKIYSTEVDFINDMKKIFDLNNFKNLFSNYDFELMVYGETLSYNQLISAIDDGC